MPQLTVPYSSMKTVVTPTDGPCQFLKVNQGGRTGGAKGGPGPSNIWNKKKKCVFNKHTIKVCISWS